MLIAERRLRSASRLLCAAGTYLRRAHETGSAQDRSDAWTLLDQAKGIIQEVESTLVPPVAARGIEVRELPPCD